MTTSTSSASSASPTSPSPGLPVADWRGTGREIWRLSHGHRLRLAAGVALGILSSAVALVPPVAIGMLVDRVREGTADLATVLLVMGVMVVSAVLGAAGGAVTVVTATRVYQTMLAELRERLVSRGMSLPQHTVERAGTGDLISRSSDDVTAVADAAPAVIPALTVTTFTIIVSLVGLAGLEWSYAVAFLVALPVYVVAMRWYLRTGPGVYQAERTAMSSRAQHLLESQRGYATVLGFGLADRRHRAVMSDSWIVTVKGLRARTVQSMLAARLNIGECLSLVAVLVVGFVLIDHGISTVGGATTAMRLVLRLLDPVNSLLFVFDTLQSALASLNRIVGVITIPEDSDVPGDDSCSVGNVHVRNLTFDYDDGTRALTDITLDISAGEHLAVVGASGAGKTTLAAVLAGIRLPDSGSVSRPARTVVVSQEVHVFEGTLRENLTLAAPDATDDAVQGALITTGADALLGELPDGLGTMVGAGGYPLTDARAQQIAITRLLLAAPDLAILDEATAEAGSSHAGQLDRAAAAVLADRTAVVIAHRLSQAVTCDRIVVMDEGRILEEGTHTDLVAANGMYASLWNAWKRTDSA
ncbi:ABC transporter [Corynebacterium sp. CNJ-954]|uniref:ABC transporter ATP-binding protein n=1 Tax=Corynebacterium sp. CNJ-954 TaxID=1904962 RepID=UPI00095A2288|nr:ABC transporter ATP-binding protein [Corynebacterium sp. CNJ-954]OLT51886.1 ABC transporter [Corynebacterium sp. CNJ-954]